MTANNRIEEGDRVRITFPNTSYDLIGVVLYTPSATGDSWVILADNNQVVYVQLFQCMFKE